MDVVLKLNNFYRQPADENTAISDDDSGICFPITLAKNCFSVYRAKTVGLAIAGAQFKRL
ncbi:hypothetical protein R2284_001726 [Cronobacter dublinensis]|nr:hypothetical protein [Cronobacter dublinensis]